MKDSAASIHEAAAQIETTVTAQSAGVSTDAAAGAISATQSSMSSAIATLQGALGTEGLDEGTAAAINSAIEQLNAGLGNASAAQGELGNIQAQSQVAVQAETNGSKCSGILKCDCVHPEGAAGSISEAASASSSTLAGEADN